MKKRHRQILDAIREIGGMATTRQIAEHLGLNVNGVSQSLGVLGEFVIMQRGEPGTETRWFLKGGK